MALTIEEAQAELATVKAAINEYILGKRRKSIKVGSHEFERTYTFSDPSEMFTWLTQRQKDLEDYINSIGISSIPTFVSYATVPLVVKSF